MNRIISCICLLFTLLVFTGCVAAPRCENIKMTPNVALATPASGKGLVFFYREQFGFGKSDIYKGYCGDIFNHYIHDGAKKRIGLVGHACYFSYQAEPGDHTFWFEFDGGKSILTMSVEEGKTYYINHAYGQAFALVQVVESYALPQIKGISYCEMIPDK